MYVNHAIAPSARASHTTRQASILLLEKSYPSCAPRISAFITTVNAKRSNSLPMNPHAEVTGSPPITTPVSSDTGKKTIQKNQGRRTVRMNILWFMQQSVRRCPRHDLSDGLHCRRNPQTGMQTAIIVVRENDEITAGQQELAKLAVQTWPVSG
jgi:hypothetical protein